MKKILSFLLIFITLFSYCYAEEVTPSITVENLYNAYGDATFISMDINSEDYNTLINFCPNIIDFMALNVSVTENKSIFFITAPFISEDYSWFLINLDGQIVANLEYSLLEDNDMYYEVIATFLPLYSDGIYYLIWIKN